MALQLPYDGIGGKLKEGDWAELQRRLEAIEGNFNELTALVDKPILNRRLVIDTSQSTSSTSFTKLTTADQVDNVHLPEGALLAVMYRAVWESSVAGAGRAAVFLNEDQLKQASPFLASPAAQEANTYGGAAAVAQLMGTTVRGLDTYDRPFIPGATAPTAYAGDVTTGQIAGSTGIDFAFRDSADGSGGAPSTSLTVPGNGGPTHIFAAPGTYSISVRYRATSGSVTASSRKLWVWTINF